MREIDEADLIGWRYYLVFTVCSFTNAILFFCLFPETKGVSTLGAMQCMKLTKQRTLEEMDLYFKNSYWFVPLAKNDRIGSKDRERDLAMGE